MGLLPVSSSGPRNARWVQAYLFDELDLCLALMFPAPHIVIGLSILQSLEHRLVGDQYPVDLLIPLTSVQ